jgi:ribosome biogenesis SPOUT family RNA methylase Rps3
MKYVIEHLEPRLFKWCVIEYKHISKIVGRENLMITNLKGAQPDKLKSICSGSKKKFSELGLSRVCVLDPEAEEMLTPADAKNFDYLVFGGILGDYPPRKRTKEELAVPGAERRHIGKEQFATDNAVAVCQQIIEEGIPFEKLKFQDTVSLEMGKDEAMDFPFRYLLVDGKPLFSDELLKFVKKRKGF